MAKTAFPEEAVSDDLMGIKFIQNRICVLIDRSGIKEMMMI